MSTQQIRTVLLGDASSLEEAGARGTRSLENLVRASGNGQRSLTQLGASSAGSARQMQLLIPQLNDVAVSLAGGQNPMMVFLQQGMQIRDVMGGWREAGSALMSLLSAKTIVLGGLAASVAVLTKAYFDGMAQSERFRDLVALTGNAAGVTEGQFNRLTDRVAAAANISAGSAREIAEGLLSTGRIGVGAMETLSTAAARYAEVSGKSSKDVLALFTEMEKGVGDGAVRLNASMNFLTAADVRRIRSMEEVGDKQGALILVGERMIAHLQEQAENLGYVERALRAIKNGWGALAEAVTSWGRRDTTEARLGALSNMLDREREALAFAQERSAGRSQEIAGRQRAIEKIQEEMSALRENIRLERQMVDARSRTAATNRAEIQADEDARKNKPSNRQRSQQSIDAEYQRMVRDTVANRPTRLADINAADYESVAKYQREQMVAAARASQQAAEQEERNRQRAIEQAEQMGQQLADQAAGVNASLITDDARRAAAQIEIERRAIQRRIDMLAQAGADVRALEDDLAAYIVARRAEANEALKPQWQKMLEGWADTNRLMRDTWNDLNLQLVQGSEQAWIELVRTGKVNAGQLVDLVLVEFARLQFRQQVAPLLGQALGALGGFLGIASSGSGGGLGVNYGLAGASLGGGGAGLVVKNALGGVFNGAPGLSAYSSTVVTRPTMFAFARGAGLMGEAGPEGILPLKRNSRGQLGVISAAPSQAAAPQWTVEIHGAPSDQATVQAVPDGAGGGRLIVALTQAVRGDLMQDLASGGTFARMVNTATGTTRPTLPRR